MIRRAFFFPLPAAAAVGSVLAFLLLGACAGPATEPDDHGRHDDHGHEGEHEDEHGHGEEHGDGHGDEHGHGESWAVTAWGPGYEVFPEIDPLVAGEVAKAHTHVTRLEDFDPLSEGRVEIVFREGGREQVFAAAEALRPGVWDVEIEPQGTGEADLLFRITENGRTEEIPGGRVRVGTDEEPGGLVVAPAPKGGGGGEPLDFLKEEQWKGDFATEWVRPGELSRSVAGLARLRPPAGGEAAMTAPVDGVLRAPRGADSWPYAGRPVKTGEAVFRLIPRIAAERSLAALEAEVTALASEREAATARLARLEDLLALEATSRREVEEAQVQAQGLEARHGAAVRDLEAARASRQGGEGEALLLKAPFSGEVASVAVTPGTTVAAGEALARLVRTDRLWIEVAASPAGARLLSSGPVSGLVLDDGEGPPVTLADGVSLVSVAPELTRATGTVAVILEAPAAPGLVLGTTLEAQVLLAEAVPGIVVPASAVIDDGGADVVYLQLSGESFLRQEVRVVERQGQRVLVEGLEPGQRLVTRGGEAIRRSSLMGTGDSHGHVH